MVLRGRCVGPDIPAVGPCLESGGGRGSGRSSSLFDLGCSLLQLLLGLLPSNLQLFQHSLESLPAHCSVISEPRQTKVLNVRRESGERRTSDNFSLLFEHGGGIVGGVDCVGDSLVDGEDVAHGKVLSLHG